LKISFIIKLKGKMNAEGWV